MKEVHKSALGTLLVIVLFIAFSYIIQRNIAGIEVFIDKGYVLGAVLYVIIITIAVVVAPVSAVPLLPLVSNMYGWFLAGLLSIVGWSLGAAIAFLISRKYGIPLVKKLIPLKKINKIEEKIPKKNLFWSIVFLRMSIPVDILSYVLGLLSPIKFRTYILATIIGVTPFAFILAYVGTLPFYYQLTALTVAGVIILAGILIRGNGD